VAHNAGSVEHLLTGEVQPAHYPGIIDVIVVNDDVGNGLRNFTIEIDGVSREVPAPVTQIHTFDSAEPGGIPFVGPVGAENPIHPGQATSRYSWVRPKTAPLRRRFRGSGSLMGGGGSTLSGDCCPRARCGRRQL